MGKVLDPNTNLILLGNGQGVHPLFGGHIHLFFVDFCPIAGLQRSIVKLKIVGTASFLISSW